MGDVVLQVDGLSVETGTAHGGDRVPLVEGVSFTLSRGEVLGIVGESGSGKSMTALSLLRLVPSGLSQAGAVTLLGRDLTSLDERELRRVRGADISMVFQDPMTGLNPVRTVGSVLSEVVRRHERTGRAGARERVVAALRAVGVPSPEVRFSAYPHQLSGGLRQRVMIAMALLHDPAVIVADEPTTALDATIQAQILELLRSRSRVAGLILITHDLGVAGQLSDRVLVMYAGNIVEEGPALELLAAPRHPYTAGLLRAAPRFDRRRRPLVPVAGTPPSAHDRPTGCPFAPRCDRVTDRCRTERPTLSAAPSARVACWHPVRP